MQILRLSSVGSKFTILRVSFFKAQVSFSSKFASLFSVMRHNSSVHFHLNFICFEQKEPNKDFQQKEPKGAQQKEPTNIFRLSTACMKINQFLMSFFKTQVSFPLNFASPFDVMTHNFSAQNLLYTFRINFL